MLESIETRHPIAADAAFTSAATDEQIRWLIDSFGGKLYRVAVAIVRDSQVAEDVVQEVLVKAWTSMPSWDGDVPIRWARTVTRNTALNVLRSSVQRRVEEFDERDPAAPTREDPADVVVRSSEASDMWAALGRLDSESRLLLVLHEIDGLSYDEVALSCELTVSAVRSKIYRARRALRSDLRR